MIINRGGPIGRVDSLEAAEMDRASWAFYRITEHYDSMRRQPFIIVSGGRRRYSE